MVFSQKSSWCLDNGDFSGHICRGLRINMLMKFEESFSSVLKNDNHLVTIFLIFPS